MIYGAGNAIIDITARITDDFLIRHNIQKGMMTLTELAESEHILAALALENIPLSLSAGGSVANSIAGIAALGHHQTALFFRVGDDALGERFIEETAASGTHFDRAFCVRPGATGRSIILVTPDGERSMLTHLGVSAAFGRDNVDFDIVAQAEAGFLEGYLFYTKLGRAAVEAMIDAGNTVITLSDPHCVTRNIDAFAAALSKTSLVIGNGKEMAALSGTTSEDGMDMCTRHGAAAVCTRSSAPILISANPGQFIAVPVDVVTRVVDTTGAGDQFAAGLLHGLIKGEDLEESAKIGGQAAGRVIQHTGGRPPLPFVSITEMMQAIDPGADLPLPILPPRRR